jgi:hypothetical protein
MGSFRAPIGVHDFARLRRDGATYVDKTALASELLRSPTLVTLLPRPRRFGKTLNLSMLRSFLERTDEDRSDLFEGLAVWEDAEARQHFGRYPVIELSFKGIKARTWADAFVGIRRLLAELAARHLSALQGEALSIPSQVTLDRILRLEAEPAECWDLLGVLSKALARHHGAQVVILIDEYDTPIHAAYVHGYYDDAITFFRAFLGGGLKDNPHLFKGVVTGILRVAKESIFSDLNNLAVYTMLDPRYSTAFGFTEAEVAGLAALAGAEARLDTAREWYDGYRFGGHVIYNPWSVLNFLAEPDMPPRPYWRLTGSDDILRGLLHRRALDLPSWEALLAGETIERPVAESLALRDLDRSEPVLWAFLLFSGYLTATDASYGGREVRARLRIPNREVHGIYESVFARWIEDALATDTEVEGLMRGLLRGDAEAVAEYLTRVLTEQASYHDFPRRGSSEALYHAFVLGLLVRLAGDYRVRSNAESGHGRADVLVVPHRRGAPGVVLELKVPGHGESVEQALASALAQIAARDYAAELRAAGADPVHALAVVFDGKRAHVRAA